MKLSEAIRLGCAVLEKCSGHLGSGDHACALGGAMYAVGLDRTNFYHQETMSRMFPVLEEHCWVVIDGEGYSGSIGNTITVLNDREGWSREKIADWLVLSGNDCEAVPLQQPEVTEQQEALA